VRVCNKEQLLHGRWNPLGRAREEAEGRLLLSLLQEEKSRWAGSGSALSSGLGTAGERLGLQVGREAKKGTYTLCERAVPAGT